ncbi:MAG: Uma2 family endonuclease [Verrucomicrobiota bacterium]
MVLKKNQLDEPDFENDSFSIGEFMSFEFDEKVELVEGKIKFMGYTNSVHASLLVWLATHFYSWNEERDWGHVLAGDAGIRTKNKPATARGAEVVCISHETYSKVSAKGKVIDVGPELVIEIISPSNTFSNIQTKIREYFQIGSTEVWTVDPEVNTITAYDAPNQCRIYDMECGKPASSPQFKGLEISLEKMQRKIDALSS